MLIMSEILGCLSMNMQASIKFNTKINEELNGFNTREQYYNEPLRQYSLEYVNSADNNYNITNAFIVAKGQLHAFLFWDKTDYQISQTFDNKTPGNFSYQLMKFYNFGSYQIQRNITKPQPNTFKVYNENQTLLIEGQDYDIDYATGIITFHNSTVQKYFAEGFFFVPVRFSQDNLNLSPAENFNNREASINASVELIECREGNW